MKNNSFIFRNLIYFINFIVFLIESYFLFPIIMHSKLQISFPY